MLSQNIYLAAIPPYLYGANYAEINAHWASVRGMLGNYDNISPDADMHSCLLLLGYHYRRPVSTPAYHLVSECVDKPRD